MNKIKFYEALYASCSDVVAHRKSVVFPLITIFAGICLALVSTLILKGVELEDISSSVMLIAILLLIGGGVWAVVRLTGRGEPYSTKQGKRLQTRTLSFDRSNRNKVLSAVNSGDIDALLSIPTCNVAAICVLISHLPDYSFAAMQAFEYAELEYKELSRVKMAQRK